MLKCHSCDYTYTKKDTLIMHKGVKHKGKSSNFVKFDYSCTKSEVLVIHKLIKHVGQ